MSQPEMTEVERVAADHLGTAATQLLAAAKHYDVASELMAADGDVRARFQLIVSDLRRVAKVSEETIQFLRDRSKKRGGM